MQHVQINKVFVRRCTKRSLNVHVNYRVTTAWLLPIVGCFDCGCAVLLGLRAEHVSVVEWTAVARSLEILNPYWVYSRFAVRTLNRDSTTLQAARLVTRVAARPGQVEYNCVTRVNAFTKENLNA